MTLIFEDDSAVIVYAFERILSHAREIQYYFIGNYIWWIASVIGLDDKLRRHIDNLASKQPEVVRGISTVPRDIARGVDNHYNKKIPKEDEDRYIPDPLRRTRKGRVNPSPQSKTQLKKARRKNIIQKL